MARSKKLATIGDAPLPTERQGNRGAGRGSEAVSADDMVIPRLQIIQDLSPQHKKAKSEYIEGAEVKMVFNTATNELYEGPLMVVPILYRKEFIIWRDQDEGGGFRGSFSTESEAEKARQELEDCDLCEVVATNQQFILVVDPDSTMEEPKAEMATVSMSMSQNKVSRKWNTMIHQVGGDRFDCLYQMEVVDDQNAAGKEYYNWKVSRKGFITGTALWNMAEEAYMAISSGRADVSRETAAASQDSEVAETEEF